MAARTNAPATPLVYLDTCLYFSVIKRETGLWENPFKVLLAATRGDVRLCASALVLAELSSYKGDVDSTQQDKVIEQYLMQGEIEWAELDLFVAQDARAICTEYRLRGADAAHLATAARLGADYFMSNDRGFPYGSTVKGVKVRKPQVVWSENLEDHQVDADAGAGAVPGDA